MLQKINCFCDFEFTEEIPEEIDIDKEPKIIDQILDGSFLNFTCSRCGKKHKPEFDIKIAWPSRNLVFEVFTELNRGEFYRQKKDDKAKTEEETALRTETIIGYPELADRLLVYRDKLEPIGIEAIKYFLHLKAEESYPDSEIDIWYIGMDKDSLEFHIHGIKENEVAMMKVPFSLYEKYTDEYKTNPKSDLYKALITRTYISVKNAMRHEALK